MMKEKAYKKPTEILEELLEFEKQLQKLNMSDPLFFIDLAINSIQIENEDPKSFDELIEISKELLRLQKRLENLNMTDTAYFIDLALYGIKAKSSQTQDSDISINRLRA